MHILICDPDKAIMEGPCACVHMYTCTHIHMCWEAAGDRSAGRLPGCAGRLPGSAGRLPGSAGWLPRSAGRQPGSAGRLPGSAGRLLGSAGRLLGSAGRLPGSAYNLTSRPWRTKGNNNREDKALVHLRPRA